MARKSNKLTDTAIKRPNLKNGLHGDGNSLYLRVQGESKSWVFIYEAPATKKRREQGLGSYPSIPLALARKRAEESRQLINRGLDPIEEKKRPPIPTVKECMTEFVETNPHLKDRYNGLINKHLGRLGNMTVDKVETSDVKETLLKVWDRNLGEKLQNALKRTLAYAMVSGHRSGPNPAKWEDHLELIMPKSNHSTTSHKALSWKNAPDAYSQIKACSSVAANAYCFTILMTLRQIETRFLTWGEVHTDRIVISAERYKTRTEHVLPLSSQARALLPPRCDEDDPNELVFKGTKPGKPLSHMTFTGVLEQLKIDCTNHGWRSTFAVWAVENGFSDDMAQRCLGHLVGNAVTRAYQRSDFFEQKKELLHAWSKYIESIQK